MEKILKDLTILYYTANKVVPSIRDVVIEQLLVAAGDIPIISISQEPISLGDNICVGDIGQSVRNIFVQILTGAHAAKTKYVAMAEDDVLYPYEHFHTMYPEDGKFLFDRNRYGIFTWKPPPMFCYVSLTTNVGLSCERELLIEALEERFEKYPGSWDIYKNRKVTVGEPGRGEKKAGLIVRSVRTFKAAQPYIYFDHEESLCFRSLGKRKRTTRKQRGWLRGWGTAEEVLKRVGF